MKNTILIISAMVLSLTMTAQESFKEYSLGGISVVTEPGKSQGDVYIDLNASGELGLSLNKNKRNEFLTFLRESHDQIVEWSNIATANNVLEAKKDVATTSLGGYFRYGGWNFGISKLTSKFVVQEGKTRGYVYIHKMTSSSNQYIKSDSDLFYLTEELVMELEEYLSDESIDGFVHSETKSDDLFKN